MVGTLPGTEPNLATCLRILSGTWWWQRGHMCGIMRTLRQGKSCMQPLLTANQFICLRDATAICPAIHTHLPLAHTNPLPCRVKKFIIKMLPHCCFVRLTANMTRGCDWEHYVGMESVQPWALYHLVCPAPPPPSLLLFPCAGQMKSIWLRRVSHQKKIVLSAQKQSKRCD